MVFGLTEGSEALVETPYKPFAFSVGISKSYVRFANNDSQSIITFIQDKGLMAQSTTCTKTIVKNITKPTLTI